MSVVMRAGAVIGGVILLLSTVAASPVEAKGFRIGVIDGEGLAEPIIVDLATPAATALIEQVGVYTNTPGVFPEHASSPDLGPKLTLTWTFEAPPGVEPRVVVHELYPYADGGPLAYTAFGQAGFDSAGGWYQANVVLVSGLEEQGVPVEWDLVDAERPTTVEANAAATESPESAASSGSSSGSNSGSGDSSPRWLPVGAILAVMFLVGGAMVVRTRRKRLAPSAT